MSECTICQRDSEEGLLIQCAHFAQHMVRLYRRPAGYYSVIRYRDGWEAEGHVGDPHPLRTFEKLSEYIRTA